VGTFELDAGEYGIITIIRTENSQIETNDFMNFHATYDVFWIDECHYELRNKKVIKGESKYGNNPSDIIKAEVLKITGSKILLKLSSNYTDFVTECEIIKIK
jgi:hypothetical protein